MKKKFIITTLFCVLIYFANAQKLGPIGIYWDLEGNNNTTATITQPPSNYLGTYND